MASTCTSQWLLDSLRILVSDLNASAEVTLEAAEEYMTRIELLYREMVATEIERGVLTENEVEVLLNLSRAYDSMSQLVDRMSSISDCTEGPVVHCGRVGRPAFLIPQEQLQCLRFSVPQIAQLLGVSVRTVRRRMSVAGLSIRSTYSQLSDDQLDDLVGSIQQQFPHCGNRQMFGHLTSRGVRVQYHRVRESQRRIDPGGSVLRQLRCMKRRKYSVKGPQHLWHVDGNHKLIR